MEKQSKLVNSILSILKNAGILSHVLLIGSWCASFYKGYFKDLDYNPVIRTRDIDFLVSRKTMFPKNVDLEALLKPFGFDVDFFGKGYMKLENDEIALEFIVPDIGRGSDKPYPLPELKLNAQPLRHLTMLWRDPIKITVGKTAISLPHPADFCIHKLIIAEKRKTIAKGDKDRRSATEILKALIRNHQENDLRKALTGLSKKELIVVKKEIKKVGYKKMLEELEIL